MPSSHALLSPSSSHRWIHCTPSPRLEEKIEEQSSSFAEEGTCAHALCEVKLLTALERDATHAEADYGALADRWYNQEMEDCTTEYVQAVLEKYNTCKRDTPSTKIFIEKRLDFSPWIPNSFGTADAVIVTNNRIEVIDFKYGKGVQVYAERNTQMMIYALGAIADYELDYDIKSVRMTIIQPRLFHISEYEISKEELMAWADNELVPQAKKAYDGEGEQVVGEWCRFCKVKSLCRKMACTAITESEANKDKRLITDDDMPRLLTLIPSIKKWCEDVESYALAQAIQGHQWKGYKIVEGRSKRVISDEQTLVENLINNGYEEGILYKKDLKGITELEKTIGKKTFSQLSEGCITKSEGKPTLVPESDKREPLNINNAFEDFKSLTL